MTDAQDWHVRRIVHALDFIEMQLTEACNARAAAQRATMSPWHFQRVFHEIVGVPVTRYIRRRRLVLAADALDRSDRPIRDVAMDVGFASHEVFTRAFRAEFGRSPSAWRLLAPDAHGRALRPARSPQLADPFGRVEVLHWWTHGAEADAAATLRAAADARGLPLRETAILGGAGQAAVTLLDARCLSGYVPGASTVQGGRMAALARRGLILPLDEVAEAGEWDRVLPAGVQSALKVDGRYHAAPIHLHRINTMLVNLAVLQEAGLAIPVDWPDFLRMAARLHAAGIPAVAMGDEPWQVLLLFGLVQLGLAGPAGPAGARPVDRKLRWSGASVFRALKLLAELRPYVLRSPGGREWFHATAAVARGAAAVQFMGDWAWPELLGAGCQAASTYDYAASPGTAGEFHFVVDGLAMFRQADTLLPGQARLCRLAMEPEVQGRISGAKGALAARLDAGDLRRQSFLAPARRELQAAARTGLLFPALDRFGSDSVRAAAANLLWRFWCGEADAERTASALLRLPID